MKVLEALEQEIAEDESKTHPPVVDDGYGPVFQEAKPKKKKQ